VFKWRPSPCGRDAFQLPMIGSCVRSQMLARLDLRALGRVGFSLRLIADIEGSVAPHGVHDHRQLACYRHHRFALAGTSGDLLALGLVLAFEAGHQTGRRLVERAPDIGIAVMKDSAITGQTPGIAMKRRHSSSRIAICTTSLLSTR